jgi:hypothetical protein
MVDKRAFDQPAVVTPVHAATALFERLGQPLTQGTFVFRQEDPHAENYRCTRSQGLKGN